ncbi:hypothetical protein PF005_g7204 [Phytophthora fragariae]|uniref:Uncharacterized protein n=1 Tax=Phytophthora fragariae TaxID=53985 RepID=A0A6A3FDB6_9STRA|nr:hypothetical protein PF009_g7906 [Phytophthora fragariae]KAE9122662.1 hypothetical protein PF010_g6677 [Phytophthora fragariae]KAE9122770.1 hypothetical protein PF007_g7327 [Phytophthora fragariae]KAE9151760.1 hypothetical protein PF006_g3984 [Phytophthora fragariae]KAE9221196.1 hypothetical protein PF005_g7204 [Phytophthora fragariae]
MSLAPIDEHELLRVNREWAAKSCNWSNGCFGSCATMEKSDHSILSSTKAHSQARRARELFNSTCRGDKASGCQGYGWWHSSSW